MSEAEFWDSTLRGITLKAEGHRRAVEMRERSEWERARWLAAIMIAPYAPKGKTIKPSDIARFPWEESKIRKLTPEEMDLIRKRDKTG